MSNNVIFKVGTLAQYEAILTKDSKTLYWLYDVLQLRKGEELYGTGAEATQQMAGLMSPEDKIKLDNLVNSGTANLFSADSAIVITDTDEGKSVGLKLSSAVNNAAVINEDGLFVPTISVPIVPEYTIERQADSGSEYLATYRLKRTSGTSEIYVGDEINIPKDLVLQSGKVVEVTVQNIPYSGANIGDLYLDLIINDANSSHIYIPANKLVDKYIAGNGIKIENQFISVQVNPLLANGLVSTEDGLGLNLVTAETAGAMSPTDKITLDKIAQEYISKDEVRATTERVKYEIAYKPEGTLVDYRDKEIRVMCPADTKWVKQNVGSTGNANMYYMGFKAYAPENAVSFKEDDLATIEDQTMYYFEGNDFAGIDEYGRKYSIVWLALASYDESADKWSYFGEKSSTEKYIGWYYSVEWYDANGIKIEEDKIRINLANENCYNNIEPYYHAEFATKDDISALEQAFSWEEM